MQCLGVMSALPVVCGVAVGGVVEVLKDVVGTGDPVGLLRIVPEICC